MFKFLLIADAQANFLTGQATSAVQLRMDNEPDDDDLRDFIKGKLDLGTPGILRAIHEDARFNGVGDEFILLIINEEMDFIGVGVGQNKFDFEKDFEDLKNDKMEIQVFRQRYAEFLSQNPAAETKVQICMKLKGLIKKIVDSEIQNQFTAEEIEPLLSAFGEDIVRIALAPGSGKLTVVEAIRVYMMKKIKEENEVGKEELVLKISVMVKADTRLEILMNNYLKNNKKEELTDLEPWQLSTLIKALNNKKAKFIDDDLGKLQDLKRDEKFWEVLQKISLEQSEDVKKELLEITVDDNATWSSVQNPDLLSLLYQAVKFESQIIQN